jgi:antitoxin VapB
LSYTKREKELINDAQNRKAFFNGRSQAVCLPKEFRLEGDEVYVRIQGKSVILTPKPKSWHDFFKKTALPSEDFMRERVDSPPQKREGI